jgi:hypothetical protein
MEATLVLNEPFTEEDDIELLLRKLAEKMENIGFPFFCSLNLKLSNTKNAYFKFYKVYKNDTVITAVSTNDFKTFKPTLVKIKAACALHLKEHPALFLPTDELSFRGFISKIKAMEFAKAGALKYISKLIDEGEKSNELLLKYRLDHYDDLNINLTDRNIRKLELVGGER